MTVKHYQRKKKWKVEAFNKHRPLAEYLIPLIGDKKEVSILDVGAGPILTTGDELEGVKVNITACDNLALEYKEIYGDLLFDVEYQDMENLTYADNSFDIVHCVNALDHTKSPRSAIAELLRVSKGIVYLRHSPNEGETQKYSGIHRWNIEMDGDDCRFWSRKSEFQLSEFGDWKSEERMEDFTTHYNKNIQIISTYGI